MARRPKSVKETKADAIEELDEQDASEETGNEVEDAAEDAPSIDAQHSQCGGVLAAARTKQGLSIKDIAQQLRLSNTQIDALEQDDYALNLY
jgi:cytoskeleton protein RodZ